MQEIRAVQAGAQEVRAGTTILFRNSAVRAEIINLDKRKGFYLGIPFFL